LRPGRRVKGGGEPRADGWVELFHWSGPDTLFPITYNLRVPNNL
jgi:hypothetical protein